MTGPSLRLLLEGVTGLFRDECYVIRLGERRVVGRSRSCDISLAGTRACRRVGRWQLENNPSFRRVSRQHFEIDYAAPDAIHIRDLSTNGIRIGGRLTPEATLRPDDLQQAPVTIHFGDGETLLMTTTEPSRTASS